MIGVPDQLGFGGLAVALVILGLALHQSLANFAAPSSSSPSSR
jgi:hypothetical protein